MDNTAFFRLELIEVAVGEPQEYYPVLFYTTPDNELPQRLVKALDHYIDWGSHDEENLDYCGFDPILDHPYLKTIDALHPFIKKEIERLTPEFAISGYKLKHLFEVEL